MFADPGSDTRDAKTRLQEWAQARGRDAGAPVYALKEQAGPDHAPRFVVEAQVKGFAPVTGEGGSKRQAEQDAAAKLLAAVGQ
jgi:ribonuclease-3